MNFDVHDLKESLVLIQASFRPFGESGGKPAKRFYPKKTATSFKTNYLKT